MSPKVHPRIRGEYQFVFMQQIERKGSPPHTRGIQGQGQGCKCSLRFTPAYAGNTGLMQDSILRPKVHPRIRGEYLEIEKIGKYQAGSPPHTRGIQRREGRAPHTPRFTPAYAGNTVADLRSSDTVKVHPRIRGEYRDYLFATAMTMGSPPHTRGIP